MEAYPNLVLPIVQDGVPEAIRTLIDGGMRVWMITGDKQETAVNIGVSCGLISSTDNVMFCNAKGSAQEAEAKLRELERATEGAAPGVFGGKHSRELVIDGETLGELLLPVGRLFWSILSMLPAILQTTSACQGHLKALLWRLRACTLHHLGRLSRIMKPTTSASCRITPALAASSAPLVIFAH